MRRPHAPHARHPRSADGSRPIAGSAGPSAGGSEPDPDELLLRLRRAAGEPPLPPLRLADPSPSARRGPAGAVVSGARRAVLRLIAPAMADLLAQIERDRHRREAESARLEERVAELERERARPGS